jgi:hypothetical protein
LENLLTDLGSPSALAAAYRIAPFEVLTWLHAIETQLPALKGKYGFFASARSMTEVADRFFAIDIGATVLGIQGKGPEDFEEFLRRRGLEAAYYNLYDSYVLDLTRTSVPIPNPPTFPTQSLAVFDHIAGESTTGFPPGSTPVTGTHFQYGALPGGIGEKKWQLDQVYNARNNRLVIQYSGSDSPKEFELELKDSSGNVLHKVLVTVPASPNKVQTLVFALPDIAALQTVTEILFRVNQNTSGDTSGDFFIHAIDFQR